MKISACMKLDSIRYTVRNLCHPLIAKLIYLYHHRLKEFVILGRCAGMFAHHSKGANPVACLYGFLDDQVLAVTDYDVVH